MEVNMPTFPRGRAPLDRSVVYVAPTQEGATRYIQYYGWTGYDWGKSAPQMYVQDTSRVTDQVASELVQIGDSSRRGGDLVAPDGWVCEDSDYVWEPGEDFPWWVLRHEGTGVRLFMKHSS